MHKLYLQTRFKYTPHKKRINIDSGNAYFHTDYQVLFLFLCLSLFFFKDQDSSFSFEFLAKSSFLSIWYSSMVAGTSVFLSKLESAQQSLINFLIPPPPTKICGSEGGLPITAKRIQLKDGRYLAYAEYGVNKADAKFKIVFCHGFTGTRLDTFNASKVEPLYFLFLNKRKLLKSNIYMYINSNIKTKFVDPGST